MSPRRALRVAVLVATLRLIQRPVRLRPATASDLYALASGLGCTRRALLADLLHLCRAGCVRRVGDAVELVSTEEAV